MVKTRQSRTKASELEQLRARLSEAEETLKAIRRGDVDAIVVDGPQGKRIFTLQSADDPYRILVERMNEGAATLNPGGTILFCNRRLSEMVGLPAERLVGSSFRFALCEKERQGFTELAHRALTNNVRDTSELLRNDGTMLPVQLSLSPLPNQDWGQSICVIATDLSEQRQAELRLRQQAALLDLAPDAIVVRDMQDRITFWNRGAESIYGWSSDDTLGKDSTELLKTEFFEPSEMVRSDLLHNGHWAGDAIQFKRNGARMIVASRSALQRDSEGAPVRILTINSDVTPHRRAEEALREGEERFRDMANNISQLAWMADEKGWVFWYNQRWFDYSGTTLEEVEGWGWQKVHHPDHVQRVVDKISRCFRNGEIWEDTFPLRSRDGDYRWFLSQAVPIRDQEGKVLRWFGTNTDITERRQVENQLRILSERFSLANAVAKVGVWEWDLSSNLATWDSTMLEMYGFPPATAITYEKWADAVCLEDRQQAEEKLRRVIDDKSEGSLEFRINRKDGSVRNISSVCRAVFDEPNKIPRLIGVNMDITERKDTEKALEKSRNDQLRFKDELLSQVSHELRTPLTAIKQFSTILLEGSVGELNPDQVKYQQIVLRNIQQLQSMIDDLLDVSRLENGKLTVQPEPISVFEVVTDALNTVHETAHAKGVSLSCDLLPALPAAYADPTRLRQILLILIDNALRFTGPGGSIKLRAFLSDQDPKFVQLEVSDTGSGIPPEDVNRIFERLYQVKATAQSSRSGLGLGLFICQGLVARQGGQIWVESKVNVGTSFSFTMPVFTINSLIAPLLVNNRWPTESVALLVVDVCLREERASMDTGDYWSYEACRRIQSCLMPNSDVLLQQIRGNRGRQQVFVAAFGDQKSVSALTDRIRGQLRSSPPLKNFSIARTLLKPVPPEPGTCGENAVNTMAAHLEAAIKDQILPEVISYEPQKDSYR